MTGEQALAECVMSGLRPEDLRSKCEPDYQYSVITLRNEEGEVVADIFGGHEDHFDAYPENFRSSVPSDDTMKMALLYIRDTWEPT